MSHRTRLLPHQRQAAFLHLLAQPGLVRLMEAHNGLSALVAEDACARVGGELRQFDGIWAGSFSDSAAKGQPDASIVGVEGRLHTVREVLRVTSKPVIVDGDTGGDPAQFASLVRELEALGVSAVIIEDKRSPKRNSLARHATHVLEDPERFAHKLRAGRRARAGDGLLVFARLESLIAGAGVDDALDRALTYLAAGADGILIHSNARDTDAISNFAETYRSWPNAAPLLCVPTTYNHVPDAELHALGFKVIIHANQLVRAAYTAMTDAARLVLEADRNLEADQSYATAETISSRVGLDTVVASDAELLVEGVLTL